MIYPVIKQMLLAAAVLLTLIWGVIFYLAVTDPSYRLFIPSLAEMKGISLPNDQPTPDLKQNGPWKQDLMLAQGNESSFNGSKILAEGAATPSAILRNNEMLVFFNYYPSQEKRAFGTIHQIRSADNGQSWTNPTQIIIYNAPALAVVPFSPKAVILPNHKIKLFFLAKKKDENQLKLFAAISDDGEKFNFDPTTVFEIEGQSLTSFALTILNSRMHLLAYTLEGATTLTAHHAISYDTSVFTRLADVVIKDSYYGQNTLVTDGSRLLLYGTSDQGLWKSTSQDGNSWSSIRYLSFNAQDPGIVKNGDSYFLYYTANRESGKN